jgi:hypothetical protein
VTEVVTQQCLLTPFRRLLPISRQIQTDRVFYPPLSRDAICNNLA